MAPHCAVYVSQNAAYYWSTDNASLYVLLILSPVFITMAMIPTFRYLGILSQVANISLLTGLCIILVISFTQIYVCAPGRLR